MAGENDAEEVDHALLCSPAEKAQREAANGLEQVEYIAELVDRHVSAIAVLAQACDEESICRIPPGVAVQSG